jgi:hypothetical protein
MGNDLSFIFLIHFHPTCREVSLTELAVEGFRKQLSISGPGTYVFPNPDNTDGCQASSQKILG